MLFDIVQAKPEDAEEACSVLRASIKEVCSPDYVDIPGFVDSWLENKTPEAIRSWIANESNAFILAKKGSNVTAGVACLGRNGEVLLCYAHPNYIGTGVGKLLLDHMKLLANDLKLRSIFAYSTRTAKAFYLSNGFYDAGEAEYEKGVAVEYKLVFEPIT